MYRIKNITTLQSDQLSTVSQILESIQPQAIACNNWVTAFPYSPEVHFRIAHNNHCIFIKFSVKEQYTMAKIESDNGKVYTDSCVEFFMSLDDSGYYNFEFSCIGKALLGFRKERPNPVHGTEATIAAINRLSSLGTANFEERTGNNEWDLTVAIPSSSLFLHDIAGLSELKARANFYKCGDNLTKPHYLSWQPIEKPKPDFHTPQFFTEIFFE